LLWLASTPLASSDDRFELTPFWGLSTLDITATGDLGFRESFEQGLHLGARFGVRLGERAVLEGEYRYSPNGKWSFFLFPDSEFPVDFGSHALTGAFAFELIESERFRPFIAAGLGMEHFRTGVGETTLRASFGGGTRFALRDHLGLRVDARYVLWPSFFLTDGTEGSVEVDVGLSVSF
jgi:hypothetical protein